MNFSQIEYLTVFSSIIFGLVVAEYLHGWGTLRKSKLRLIHLRFIFWTLFQMLFLTNVWWGSWVRGSHLSEHIGYYFLSLTTPLLLYLISVVTFPDQSKIHTVDLLNYFRERFQKIMFLYFLVMISIMFNTYFFNDSPFFRIEVLIMFSGALLALSAMFAQTQKSQTYVLIVCWTLLIIHILFIKNDFPRNPDEYFTQNEYLSIFIAIVYGYVASIFFSGWGKLIRNYNIKQIEVFHLFWTILAFLLLIDMWWSSWDKMEDVVDNIGYFILSMMPATIFYFLGIALFSVLKSEKRSLQEHFRLASPNIFRLFAIVLVLNIVISVIFDEHKLYSPKNIFRVLGAGFAILASIRESRKIQLAVLIVGYCIYILHLMVDEFQIFTFKFFSID